MSAAMDEVEQLRERLKDLEAIFRIIELAVFGNVGFIERRPEDIADQVREMAYRAGSVPGKKGDV